MRMLKIYGEHTRPTNQPSLCHTCRAAMIVRGTRASDDRIVCRNGLGSVRFIVTECNAYDDANRPDISDSLAWFWLDDRFVSPAERMRLNRATPMSPLE